MVRKQNISVSEGSDGRKLKKRSFVEDMILADLASESSEGQKVKKIDYVNNPFARNALASLDPKAYDKIMKRRAFRETVIFLVVLAAVLLSVISCVAIVVHEPAIEYSPEREAYFSDTLERDWAWVQAQYFIEDELYSPKSVKYGWEMTEDRVTKIGVSTYRIRSYLDAKNPMGVKTRSYFELTVESIGDHKWRLVGDIAFSNRDVCRNPFGPTMDPNAPSSNAGTTNMVVDGEVVKAIEASVEEVSPETNNSAEFDSDFVRTQAKKLYKQLLRFKNDQEYLTLGLGRGSKYYSWSKEIERLTEMIPKGIPQNEHDIPRFNLGVAVYQIQQLGQEYIGTRGQENEFTRYTNSEIKSVLFNGEEFTLEETERVEDVDYDLPKEEKKIKESEEDDSIFRDWLGQNDAVCVTNAILLNYSMNEQKVTLLQSSGKLTYRLIEQFSREEQEKIRHFKPNVENAELNTLIQLVNELENITPPKTAKKASFGVRLGASIEELSENEDLFEDFSKECPLRTVETTFFLKGPSKYNLLSIDVENGYVVSISGSWKNSSLQFKKETVSRLKKKYELISESFTLRYEGTFLRRDGISYGDTDTIIEISETDHLYFSMTNENCQEYSRRVKSIEEKIQLQTEKILKI